MKYNSILTIFILSAAMASFKTSLAQAPPKTPAATAIPAQASPGQLKRVSNVFQDTDLKQALSDLAVASGASIVPDDTVQGNVSASIKNRSIEEALDLLLMPGGYCWTKIGESYLVGKAEPTSPNFLRFATSRMYKPNYMTGEKLAAQLPSSMAGYIKAVAGDRTLIITASPAMMERILHDVHMLDVPATRIVLEALITEASTDALNQFDLTFTWKHFGFSSDATAPSMQLQYTQAAATDVATLKALISKGVATLKASPRIMTLEGKEAFIEVGQESYFDVVSGPVNFPYTTLQQIKTGISLKMTPYLSEDGQITVQLNPEVSDVTGAGLGGLPINTVRRANTTVRVKEGETIIIGGMTFENKRRLDSKVPLLGEIPLIGNLFHFYHSEIKKQDVIIMITPRVIHDSDSHAELVAKQLAVEQQGTSEQAPQDRNRKPEAASSDSIVIKPVSINTGSLETLAAIPEIGVKLATKLCAYRRWHAPFAAIEDLVHVPGFSIELVHAISKYVQV